jgi:hypothetical protein
MARRNLSHPSTTVPSDVRPKFEAITALTDAFCREHLNEEYAEMCRARNRSRVGGNFLVN